MPGARLEHFLETVAGHGACCVELRVGAGEPVTVDMSESEAAAVGDACRAAGLTVLALASYVRVCAPGDDGEAVADLVDHLRLAAALGASAVRVFPGGVDGGRHDDARASRRLAAAAPLAVDLGVRLLLETHDSHPTGADLVRVLDAAGVGPDLAGVIWDAAHPWIAGEDPATTAAVVAPWLSHVQIKDASARQRGATPALIGDGVLPLGTILNVLDESALRTPLVLEWEKAWFDEIPDLDEALAATVEWLAARS